jgi:hypothetical protein
MSERVLVEFNVVDRDKFLSALTSWDQDQERKGDSSGETSGVISFRAGDMVDRRAALVAFVDEMERKLRNNEFRRNWREKPVEALFELAILKVKEFQVAHEFFPVGEARPELIDAANFLMMLWDRLGLLDQTIVAAHPGQPDQNA